ncbi:MAG: outer membrane lipoprotein carrier protein LolA [Candidatus Neomarinimicrobiota bacterium]
MTISSLHKFFVVLLCGFVLAFSSENDTLEQVKKYYLSSVPFQVQLTVRQKSQAQKSSSETVGAFYLGKNDRFRVDFPEQTVIFDGKALWSLDKKTDQVIVEEVNPRSGMKLIYDLMIGNWSGFSIGNCTTQKPGSLTRLQLTPKDKNAFFKSITLTIDLKSGILKSIVYRDFQKNDVTIVIADEKSCEKEEKEIFRTDQFQKKQIIDLRNGN